MEPTEPETGLSVSLAALAKPGSLEGRALPSKAMTASSIGEPLDGKSTAT